MGNSRKKPNRGGLRKWKLQGYRRNSMWKFQGSIRKEVEYSGMFKKKSSWNLYGSCFLILGLQVVLYNFAEFPGLWKLNFSGIIKGKVTNLRIPGGFSKSISSLHSLPPSPSTPPPPPFGFFVGTAYFLWHKQVNIWFRCLRQGFRFRYLHQI